ncbi:MAG: peptidylprolyl isomerase [bacterium]|uniref:Peptidylprolyl isomerase n=2 Tax=Candidatus Methylomirabilis TaxID=1170227 RepID=A0AAJ1EJN5_9BACT|nr:peptidylprolyl isomerase [Candidatus Methylomirabilis sp.]
MRAFVSEAVILDRVVAVVNDDVITLTEVQEEGLQAIRRIMQETPGMERERQLRSTERQILDELILRRLQLQEAQKDKTEATPVEIQSTIEELKKRNGLASDEELRAALSRELLSEEQFRKGIAEQVVLTKLVARRVRAKVVVLDEEVQQYYEQQQAQFKESPQFKIRHLLVTVPPQATPSEISRAKNRIEEAKELLKTGANFSTVAKQYSEGPLASASGEVWTMKRGELAPELEQAVLALPIGQASDVITTPAGFHLIVVEERAFGQGLAFDQVKERLRAILFEQKTEAKFKEWIESLKTKAHVEKKL